MTSPVHTAPAAGAEASVAPPATGSPSAVAHAVPPPWRTPVVATAALLAVAALGHALGSAAEDYWRTYGLNVFVAVAYPVLGALVVQRRPGHLFGRVLLATGFASALPVAAAAHATLPPMTWAAQWSPWLTYAMLPLPVVVFPDGRLPSPRWRAVPWIAAAAVVLPAALLALAALEYPATLADPDVEKVGVAAVLLRVAMGGGALLLLVGTVGAVALLVVRWRRAAGDARAQMRIFALGAALVPVALAIEILWTGVGIAVAGVALPAAGTAAILRYGLYDIDLFLNRSLVWAGLTALVIGAYVAIVTLVQGLLPGASLLATGVIAAAFQPARSVVQRGVNRLLYGERDDAYGVMARLGQRLARAENPDAVLPEVVDSVLDGLQVPYAAIELDDREGTTEAVRRGRLVTEPEVFPMRYQGEVVGRLLVAPRSPHSPLSSHERRLLTDLARHAGAAAHAVRLTADLRRSRERLVRSREEERRRLRRDLHDGLGPALAAMVMQVGAARAVPPARVAVLLDTLEDELQRSIGEVRRLVDDLRPPALATFGLVGALDRELQAFSPKGGEGGLDVRFETTDLGELPAAVEVAAYRIVLEAVTNVVRHASATTCTVRLGRRDHLLLVDVVDDGVGLPPDRREGVGLGSMRERAEELGGMCRIEAGAGGGTLVTAALPLTAS